MSDILCNSRVGIMDDAQKEVMFLPLLFFIRMITIPKQGKAGLQVVQQTTVWFCRRMLSLPFDMHQKKFMDAFLYSAQYKKAEN